MKQRLERLGLSGAFAAIVALFFVWGLIGANNDPLVAALREIFRLSYSQALLTQVVSFLGFGLMAFPAAWISGRLGPVRAILVALGVVLAGCLMVATLQRLSSYPAILAGLFVIAIGITTLQVAANPLALALGPPRSGPFRLTLAQSFNSLGVVLGVHFAATAILSDPAFRQAGAGFSGSAGRIEALGAIGLAYALLAALVAGLVLFVWMQRGRIDRALGHAASPAREVAGLGAALRCPWALAGAVAIALYVGAEVTIASLMINFLNGAEVMDLPFDQGARMLANVYWLGALAGRLIGSALLVRLAAPRLLGAFAAGALVLCGVTLASTGPLAGYAALSIGFANSIMFPTIFSISLERARAPATATSGLLCFAIASGALIPGLAGQVADRYGLGAAFALPAASYAVILAFAICSVGRRRAAPDEARERPPHS